MTVLATVLMSFAAYYLQSSDTKDRFVAAANAGFSSDVKQAASFVPPDTWDRGNALSTYMSGRSGVGWSIFEYRRYSDTATGMSGEPVPMARSGYYDGHLPHWMLEETVLGSEPVRSFGHAGDGARWLIIAGLVHPDLVLVEFYSMQKLDHGLTKLQRQLAGIALTVAIVATTAGIAVARRLQRPIRDAAAAAQRLGSGALHTRLSVRGRDELADLAGSFNSMAQQLGRSIDELRAKDQQQRRFVADVAHDLRTPVGAMLAAAESLDSLDETARARATVLLAVQARRLARLVEDLLEISRFDAGAADFRPEQCDLRDLVTDAIEWSGGEAEVRLNVMGDVAVTVDPRRIHT
ncbi:MAG: sensor histidine kinase, partial [Pseudonocardiaceae bacterium]